MKARKRRRVQAVKTIEVDSMPIVKFAHVHSAESYSHSFIGENDRMEVSIISEGSLWLGYGGEEYEAKKGDVLCMPYSPIRMYVRTDAFHEHRTVLASFKRTELNNINGLYLPLITPASLGTEAAQSIIEQLIKNPLLFKDSPTRGASMFLDLLCEIDRCNKAEKKTAAPSDVLYVKRAKKYVQSNIRRPITQREVAEHLSITPEYLCAVFKKNEGITFKRYVNTEKLEAIRLLMRTEHMRLCDASAAFGYSDPNYVSRLFKKYYEYNITEIKKRQI